MIVSRSEPFLGVVLQYDTQRPLKREPIPTSNRRGTPSSGTAHIGIGFIGAGSYAQSNLLPNLPQKIPWLSLRGVLTNSGTTSKRVAERFGFAYCTEDEAQLLGDSEINTLFVATRHDSHAEYVTRALRAGKHVFVEKPLCIRREELDEIEALLAE